MKKQKQAFPKKLLEAFERYTEQVQFESYVLPANWKEIEHLTKTARSFKNNKGIAVIVGIELHDDKRWKHVSASHRMRVPKYQELCEIKTIFIGEDELALQVFPPKEEKVNFHPHCLHLFSPMDERPIPDFRTFFGVNII